MAQLHASQHLASSSDLSEAPTAIAQLQAPEDLATCQRCSLLQHSWPSRPLTHMHLVAVLIPGLVVTAQLSAQASLRSMWAASTLPELYYTCMS